MQTFTSRPQINTDGLPKIIKARVAQKAAQSWCYVTEDGRSFYVTETQARNMQAAEGGSVFPPAA